MKQNFCQSCAMPMGAGDEMYGTEADGSKNEDYCKYCYDQGAFTFDGDMDEMIEICVPHMVAANEKLTADDARNMMREIFPHLKRWQA
ncbi:MAG: zinc ribbon domain-containing protein [Syntrophomonadaceae bacterium]|nr:zinc ribbon domain-containing protein [Syntrophomonadaceae bacterium]